MTERKRSSRGKAPPPLPGVAGGWRGIVDAARRLGAAKRRAKLRGELPEQHNDRTFADYEREERRRGRG